MSVVIDKRQAGGIFFSASDSLSWSLCHRRAWLDYNPPEGFTPEVDRFDELVMEMGLRHEDAVLATLGPYEEALDAEDTKRLMDAKTPLIYQGVIVDETRRVICKPDFLRLDDGVYRAEDAKLSSDLKGKKDSLAQIGCYDIVLGTDRPARGLLSRDGVYEITDKDRNLARQFMDEMRDIVDRPDRPEANFTASKCDSCPYKSICKPEFEASGNLGLNYFVDNRAIPTLNAKNIHNLEDLSKASTSDLTGTPYLKKQERQRNAILQAKSLLERSVVKLRKTLHVGGTPIHFDIETWPFGGDDGSGTIYLYGFLPPPYRAEDYEYVWADEQTVAGDQAGWEAFLAKINEYRQRYDDCTFVHYTDFELHQIRMYSKRFDMEDDDTVLWMLNDDSAFFDIKEAISDSLILPVHGYGLKHICKDHDLVNFQWELEESGSQWSVVRFWDMLNADSSDERAAIRDELLIYNRDDVLGTYAQQVWLEHVDGDQVEDALVA